MRSRSRLIVKGLKESDFKCPLEREDERLLCSDCGVEMKWAMHIIGRNIYCKDCSPWYKEQAEIDRLALEADLQRESGINPPRRAIEELEAELDYGERDYWD